MRWPHLSIVFAVTLLTLDLRAGAVHAQSAEKPPEVATGVDAELHVFEAMPHIGFAGAPEDEELQAEELRFLDKHLGRY